MIIRDSDLIIFLFVNTKLKDIVFYNKKRANYYNWLVLVSNVYDGFKKP